MRHLHVLPALATSKFFVPLLEHELHWLVDCEEKKRDESHLRFKVTYRLIVRFAACKNYHGSTLFTTKREIKKDTMESVKKERVSPLLGEGGSYDSSNRTCVSSAPTTSVQTTHDLKPPVKTYHPQQPTPQPQPQPQPPQTAPLPSSPLPTVITSVPSSTGGGSGRIAEELNGVGVSVDGELLTGQSVNFSGEISDAVTKILEDYDWSKIPLANK